jgi:GT2 family glycosyltransferase
MKFSVVIVSLNGEKRMSACLGALRKAADSCATNRPGDAVEVIVIDNGSTDNTFEAAWRHGPPDMIVERFPQNLGFAGGNNEGIARATGDAIILLNDDAYLEPGFFEALSDAAEKLPDWGALGCLLLYPGSRKVQHAGGVIEANALTKHLGWGDAEDQWRQREPFACDYVTGAAIALRREAVEVLGPLDPDYFPIYFEETDYCVLLRQAGWGVYMVPSAVALHDESQTTLVRSAGFYQKYHRHRYRFILKTRTRPELWATLKAELRWLQNRHHWNHLPYVWHALWKNLLALPKTRKARKEHFAKVRKGRERQAL